MTPDIVVDVGNTRIKWGHPGRVQSLPPDDPAAWGKALNFIGMADVRWAVAGVHPARRDRFVEWAKTRGTVLIIDNYTQIPLTIEVDEPAGVGIDRLLNAVGFWPYLGGDSNTPGVLIDVGTAVTIDLLLEGHRFVGGAILPGPRLMFDSLHRHTAKLPMIDVVEVPNAEPPGKNTRDAMLVGVMAAIMGAADFLVREYTSATDNPPWVMLTGGALGALANFEFADVRNVLTDHHLTLDGIRRTAQALP